MGTMMPDVIDAYIQASNSRDADRFESLFTVDAIVHDEGQESARFRFVLHDGKIAKLDISA